MFKLVLSLILIGSATFVGNHFSSRLESRRRTLSLLVESIKKMKTLICFGGYEVYRVIALSFENAKFFDAFCSQPRSEMEFFDWWNECVDNIENKCGLNKEDKTLLKRFAEGIGVTDIEGQIANCELYSELFSERLSSSKETEKNKAQLYRVLGFSVGCAVVLLML